MSSAPNRAVFYVTDMPFIIPTLISAYEMRKWTPRDLADVRIVTIDFPDEIFDRLKTTLSTDGIFLDRMGSEAYAGFDETKFNVTHVPRSTLGRFFMLDYAGREYENIVYVDGDTWIRKDPSALISWNPSSGYIAAAEGPSYYFRNDISRHGFATRRYFSGINLKMEAGYFNAGILAADTKTWRAISKDAFAFFVNNTEACVYHDESALNAVAQDRRVRLSPRWNFNSSYRFWDVEDAIDPVIYHFTGAPKPWTGAFVPWAALHEPYRNAIAKFKSLGLNLNTTPVTGMARKNEKQLAALQSVLRFRRDNRQRDVRHICANSISL